MGTPLFHETVPDGACFYRCGGTHTGLGIGGTTAIFALIHAVRGIQAGVGGADLRVAAGCRRGTHDFGAALRRFLLGSSGFERGCGGACHLFVFRGDHSGKSRSVDFAGRRAAN
jgi:hypothetical protein